MMRHQNISRFLANCFLPIILLLIIFSRQATPVQAADATSRNGTPASCTESAFDTALATVQGSGSGTITFDCGSTATILFTSQKAISGEVTIDGDDKIILSGANSYSAVPGVCRNAAP